MPADPARVKSVFLAAADLSDAAARAALLAEQCGDDVELRQRVEALLRVHDTPPDATADVVADPPTATFGDPAATTDRPGKDEHVGAVLAGRYKLVEEIGEGGMGQVFMAQQTEPVKRAVAVKVIKAGMDSKAVLARFEAERQALAMMDHPNIARVLDAGTTGTRNSERGARNEDPAFSSVPRSALPVPRSEGRPFFVMELVKGTPITQYCDERRLTPRERLELFVPVCQAIQHAHQKGVIHRDLKPSNVLVALYDDRPVPKVIDFGVAKAAGQSLTDKTLMTGFGAVVGTPEYMSPEQASLNNLDIDTRSDVYSLGVLLYELLTGSTPVDRKSLGKAALLEILRVVREVEAPRPSAKLSTIETLPSVAANRGTEPAKLSRLMKGELDWVVLKALEKDRTRRYDTANGLARDIQRYLADEVVEARPPSTRYRLKKFVTRHKGQVVAAGLVLFALLAGVVGTTLGLVEARRQTDIARGEAAAKEQARAEESRQRATAEANEKLAGDRLIQVEAEKQRAGEEKRVAEAVKDFLQYKLLAQADTKAQADALLKAGGASSEAKLNPTIGELLDRAAQELAPDKIEANFPGQPLVQAEILRTVGAAYRGIGQAATAIDLLNRSVELFRRHLGPDDPSTLNTMSSLAVGYWAARKLDRAVPLYEEVFQLTKAKLGPDHPDTLRSMNNLAQGYRAIGQADRAVPLFEEVFKLRKAKLGPDHPSTLVSMTGLAQGYHAVGKLDLALPLFEEAFKLRKAKLGPDHPDTLNSMGNLAAAYHNAGKPDLALPLFEESHALLKAKLGPDHPTTLTSMANLAAGYQEAGKLDQAVPLFEETLKLTKAKLGPDHPQTLNSMGHLALGYLHTGKLDQAVPLFEESFKLLKAKLGPDHPYTLHSMNNLAAGYLAAGKPDLALPLYEETLKLTKAKIGPDHPTTLNIMNNLAAAYRDAGQPDRALPLHEEVVKLRKAKLGPDHPSNGQLAYLLVQFGRTLLELKRYPDAEPLLREAVAIREKTQPDGWGTFNAMSLLGGALLGQTKYADAEPLLLKGYDGLKAREKAIPSASSTRIPEALDRLVEFYTATDKPDEAAKWRAERAKYPDIAPPPRVVVR